MQPYRVLANTPPWVFALLAYLAWQGVVSLRPRTVPVWRALVVPSVFILLGLQRLALAQGLALEPYLLWLAAAVPFALLGANAPPRILAADRARGLVTLAGSPAPLIRNITVFGLQYALTAAYALRLNYDAAIAGSGYAVTGATAGYFAGWTYVLLRRYRAASSLA